MRSSAILFLIVGALLGGGGARLALIERDQGDSLRARAARQQSVTYAIPAQRGDIFDARGRMAAGSSRRASIYVDPSLVDDPRFAAHSVAPLLGMNPTQLEMDLREQAQRRFVWLRRGVSDEELRAFNAVKQARHLYAFGVMHEPTRVYPLGRVMPHVLGFVSADQQALAGVELAYDAFLRGEDGARTVTVDARRRRVRATGEDDRPPRDGASIVLTIDARIQQIAEEHLRKAVLEKHKAEWGVAVVMDPQSGEVLAMAVCPDFDPTNPVPPGEPVERALERARNRAICDAYEPGSSFKPFVASPALQERLVGIDEVFAIHGPYHKFGSRTIRDTHAYDALALHEIISKSSNIGMGLIGARAGNDRLNRWVRSFGFGDVTGVGLPGESPGLLNDISNWTSFSTQSIPIGQEIGVTALQLATAFSSLANGGILYRPRVVRGVLSSDGQTLVDDSTPVAVRRVLSAAVCAQFRKEALVETVTDGTAQVAALPDYQVFGKTGTAQVAREDGRGYQSGVYTATFMGGAPSDRPRVVVVVSIRHPTQNGYYGGQVSAPVVKEIIAATLEYMRVPAELQPRPPGGTQRPRSAQPARD